MRTISRSGQYERAKALAAEFGKRPLVAHCHLGLTTLSWRAGEHDEAQMRLNEARAMYRDMDMHFWIERMEPAP